MWKFGLNILIWEISPGLLFSLFNFNSIVWIIILTYQNTSTVETEGSHAGTNIFLFWPYNVTFQLSRQNNMLSLWVQLAHLWHSWKKSYVILLDPYWNLIIFVFGSSCFSLSSRSTNWKCKENPGRNINILSHSNFRKFNHNKIENSFYYDFPEKTAVFWSNIELNKHTLIYTKDMKISLK